MVVMTDDASAMRVNPVTLAGFLARETLGTVMAGVARDRRKR
jgi:hypothetical protein